MAGSNTPELCLGLSPDALLGSSSWGGWGQATDLPVFI